MKDLSCISNVVKCSPESAIHVKVANGHIIVSSHVGHLIVPDGSTVRAYLFPEIVGSLLSVSEFIDLGFQVIYDAADVKFNKSNRTIFSGRRDPITKLWMIDLSIFKQGILQTPNVANPAVRLQSVEELVKYWHASFAYPVKATFIRALSSFLIVPGLTAHAVKKHLPNVVYTALGHLDATREHIRSTKVIPTISTMKPKSSKSIWMEVHDITGRVYADATGAMPLKGYNGAKYILIFYCEDKNYIFAIAVSSRQGPVLLAALQQAISFFKLHFVDVSKMRMDNECSNALKDHLRNTDTSLELTPAGQHRQNKAERAIRTYKNHLIAGVSGIDEGCPANQWPRFLLQLGITLNLLRRSPNNEKMSAYEDMFGAPYDFNRFPIAPLGIKVVSHVPPAERDTWAQHGVIGYYIGPALEHYRCYDIYIPTTKSIRVSDCVEWFPAHVLEADNLSRLAALPLLPPPSESALVIPGQQSGEQRVVLPVAPPTAGEQRVVLPVAPPIVGEQRVVLPKDQPMEVQLQNQEQAKPRKREYLNNRYLELTVAELNHLDKAAVKKIGMKFIDNEDPMDTVSGVIISVVKHKKSRKLQFKYYDDNLFDEPPKGGKSFEYINVKYALQHCTFQKYVSHWAALVELVDMEERQYNFGTTQSTKRRKQQRQRRRPRLEWYHRLNGQANAVSLAQVNQDAPRSAFTAMYFNADGSTLTSTSALKGPDKDAWIIAHGEEITRLIETETMRIIHKRDIPKDRAISYYNPQLTEKIKNGILVKRVRGTVGGDKLPYDGPTAAMTADLETMRIVLNAIASEGACMMTADIENFYLGCPMDRAEYMRIPVKFIPDDIVLKYDMKPYIVNGYIYVEINKTLYGLKQAGILSQQRLVDLLSKRGYHQAKNTPCLFTHENNGTAFSLVVDDFLVKYKDETTAKHFIDTLEELYTLKVDKSDKQKYIGITINYNRKYKYIDLSMPGYVDKAMKRFQKTDIRGVDSPIIYVPPIYGPQTQMIKDDTVKSPSLSPAQILRVQEIVGVFLYYSRAVDPMMVVAINKIGSKQASADATLMIEVERFLQYASRWKDAMIRIHASDMKLQVHSDASYLSETKSRSRAGAYMFLGTKQPGEKPNGAVLFLSTIISTVVDSAAAAEYAALFIAAQAATSLRLTLSDLGYPQEATPIICDNECAVGIANASFTQKRSKTIDMRYHWIRDQVKLNHFTVTWERGLDNLADFFTKAHPVHHHLKMMEMYLVTDEKGVLEYQIPIDK